jgi:Xaa-Pro aminopeptidase
MARRLIELLPNAAIADCTIDRPAAIKTDEEIAHAHEATRIAESGYRHLLDIARPGVKRG